MEKLAHEGRPMAPATEGKADVDASSSPVELRSPAATGSIPNALFDRMLLDEARILPPEEVAVIAADYARDPFKEWDAPIVRDLLATCEYLQSVASTPTTPQSSTSPAPTMGEV